MTGRGDLQNMTPPLLRPTWRRVFRTAWILSLVLFLALAALRAYGLFGPASARMSVMLGFFSMWFLPFVFLTPAGRLAIGLKRVDHPRWWLLAILIGIGSSVAVFGLGYVLYGHGPDNWSVSILNSWAIDSTMLQLPRPELFLIYTGPAILFSPVGEELFFRGIVHESVVERWGQRLATLVNAVAFAGVHALHHGLTWDGAGLHFALGSGLLWLVLILGLSWLFTECRRRSGSIWPAVAAHATFNLVTSACIFWVLL
jgi:membrane protease YdiL (CAAX protease family)